MDGELVDGLLVRYVPVQCSCGECEEPQDVVVVAVPGEDRWLAVSASVPEAWPVSRFDEDEEGLWWEVASRMVALYGLPWEMVDERRVRVQVSTVAVFMRSRVLLDEALGRSREECLLEADGADVLARALVQAATS